MKGKSYLTLTQKASALLSLPQMIYILINEFSSFTFWGITDMFGILSIGSFHQEGACGGFWELAVFYLWAWMVEYREKTSLCFSFTFTATTTLHFRHHMDYLANDGSKPDPYLTLYSLIIFRWVPDLSVQEDEIRLASPEPTHQSQHYYKWGIQSSGVS